MLWGAQGSDWEHSLLTQTELGLNTAWAHIPLGVSASASVKYGKQCLLVQYGENRLCK